MSYADDMPEYGGIVEAVVEKPLNWLGKVLKKFTRSDGTTEFKTVTQVQHDNGYSLTFVDHLEQVEKKLYDEGIKDEYHSVLPAANQLQIDIDLPEVPAQFRKGVDILVKAMDGPVGMTTYRSRHGRRHIVLDCPKELDDLERIAWQAVLGSDGIREAMCLLSLVKGIKNGVLLIQRKDGTDKLESEIIEPTVRKFR